jgi:large subunit ribosomal protein L5
MSTATEAPPARLKTRYLEEIRPALISRFGYSSVMQAPRIEKITLNMGVGGAKQDSKVLKSATEQLATIAGQAPSVRRARKSIAAVKLREGNPVGVAVTLRSERAYEFLDRLVSIAIPRIRDFRGLNPRSFDGRGNYSMSVREQIIFPEIDYDAIDEVRGLDITISTSAHTDAEAFALLLALGMPFATQGRPRGFDDPDAQPAAADADADADADAQASTPQAAEPEAEVADAPAAIEETAAAEESEVDAAEEPEVAAEPEAEAAEAAGEGESASESEGVAEVEAPEEPAVAEEEPQDGQPVAEASADQAGGGEDTDTETDGEEEGSTA